jgi:hypothetical protein
MTKDNVKCIDEKRFEKLLPTLSIADIKAGKILIEHLIVECLNDRARKQLAAADRLVKSAEAFIQDAIEMAESEGQSIWHKTLALRDDIEAYEKARSEG